MPSIVVDASVARSAGETQFPISSMCREFLMAMYDNNHEIVLSDDLKEEWDEHSSKFSIRWLATMYRSGRVITLGCVKNEKLRQEIVMYTNDTSRVAPMLKDIHLVDAALATDKIVASRDNKVRTHFKSVVDKVTLLKNIMWINPSDEQEQAVNWLLQGGNIEKHRLLGYDLDQSKRETAVGLFSSPITEM